MISFILFMCLLVAVVAVLAYKARKSRNIDQQTEETAKISLLAVGSVVERLHQERPGEPPLIPPAGWYPPKKHSGTAP